MGNAGGMDGPHSIARTDRNKILALLKSKNVEQVALGLKLLEALSATPADLDRVFTARALKFLARTATEWLQGRERTIDDYRLYHAVMVRPRFLAMRSGDPEPRPPLIDLAEIHAGRFTMGEAGNPKAGEGCLPPDQVYRLPTEAEWEYACRGGTTTAYSFGEDSRMLGHHGWFCGNSEGRLREVARKRPNPWGLFDMHGNVWEWCADWHAATLAGDDLAGPPEGSLRVSRGGLWEYDAFHCRSAHRGSYDPRHGSALLWIPCRTCRLMAQGENPRSSTTRGTARSARWSSFRRRTARSPGSSSFSLSMGCASSSRNTPPSSIMRCTASETVSEDEIILPASRGLRGTGP